jgi:hypothetical protein
LWRRGRVGASFAWSREPLLRMDKGFLGLGLVLMLSTTRVVAKWV